MYKYIDFEDKIEIHLLNEAAKEEFKAIQRFMQIMFRDFGILEESKKSKELRNELEVFYEAFQIKNSEVIYVYKSGLNSVIEILSFFKQQEADKLNLVHDATSVLKNILLNIRAGGQ